MKITVTISRDEGQWEATASGVIGGFTHTRLATLKRSIEEIVQRMFPDKPDEPLEIVYNYELPGSYSAYLDAKAHLDDAKEIYSARQVEVIGELVAAGVSRREAAEILELSSARIQQLA